MRKIRGYQAYEQGAKACADGTSRAMRLYMDDRYLRRRWLDGWEFNPRVSGTKPGDVKAARQRQKNVMAQLGGQDRGTG